MRLSIILVALVAVWPVAARAGDKPAGEGHQPSQAKLERACGSCHGGHGWWVWLGVDQQERQHPWHLASMTELAAGKTSQTVKSAFLGIGVEKPSETVRAQLDLPDGVGLVVNFVEEPSPAQEAGLRRHDVVQKLDDQLLVNEEQLVTLVRLRKPGDSVTLALVRGGRPRTITLRLGQKDLAAVKSVELSPYADVMTQWLSAPTTQPVRYVDALEGQNMLLAYTTSLATSVTVGPITVDDGRHVIMYTPRDGGVLVAMEKESGAILFNGPVATDEQWQAVPEKVRQKLQELHESFGRGRQRTPDQEPKN